MLVATAWLEAGSRARAANSDLPRCLEMRAELSTTLDSAKAVSGDVFHFRTLDEVPATRGVPDIPAGTLGYGIVAFADHAHGAGQPGRLVLEPRFVRLADGTHVQVLADPEVTDNFAVGSTRNVNGALGLIPILGLPVAGYNVLHRGREISVPKGTIFDLLAGDELAAGNCLVAPPDALNVR